MSYFKATLWTQEYINDLPDVCFALIEKGGVKDTENKTKPRSLRHLPFKDMNGKVDLPHLRDALAMLSHTKLSPELKEKARKKLVEAAKDAGVETSLDEKKSFLEDWQAFGAWQAACFAAAGKRTPA
ncbi:MAG TPA: hypothetical protein VK536_01625 [Candidatus Limnocylindrales bacterium]|nr:hypothetical protein [Candidatus Limnocylindrales bacterium]